MRNTLANSHKAAGVGVRVRLHTDATVVKCKLTATGRHGSRMMHCAHSPAVAVAAPCQYRRLIGRSLSQNFLLHLVEDVISPSADVMCLCALELGSIQVIMDRPLYRNTDRWQKRTTACSSRPHRTSSISADAFEAG